jgi:TolB-like protein/tetratricopeptide (TPR) repeat protein
MGLSTAAPETVAEQAEPGRQPPPMSDASTAVFLSYASQDAEVARRLCEALRAAGLEVWFDAAGGLEHGDEWDAKIRRQIKACLLFIPIVSAHTQARPEGYFRLEWDLAAERARGIASGIPFILPVVLGDLPEPAALVPERFHTVQWTRLRDGAVPPEVVQRFQQLWRQRASGAILASGPTAAPFRSEATGRAPATAPSRPRWNLTALVWPLAGVAAIAGFVALGLVWSRQPPTGRRPPPTSSGDSPAPGQAPQPSGARKATPSAPVASTTAPAAPPGSPAPAPANSVAVLPFTNLGPDKADEHLSDGLAVEILSTLSRLPGLRVPARASSFVFKDRAEEPRRIGEQLGVATLLSGTVLRAGQRLRITAELVKAADGFPLWSEKFDRPFDDIFEVQTEIARAIAARLLTTMGGGISVPANRRLTRNIEAYELLLKGAFHLEKISAAGYREAIACYRQALARQPDYAPAHAGLASAFFWSGYFSFASPSTHLPEMRAAAARALALDDQLADAHLSQGTISFYVDRDWPAAERAFQRAIALDPAYVFPHMVHAIFLSAMGRHREAIAEAGVLRQIDPLSVLSRWCEGWVHFYARDYDRAEALGRQLVALAPDFPWALNLHAWALFRRGQHAEAIALAEKSASLAPLAAAELAFMYGRTGRTADARRILEDLLPLARRQAVPALAIASIYDGLRDLEQHDAWMTKAIAGREGNVVLLRVVDDDLTRAHPRFPAWLQSLGLAP